MSVTIADEKRLMDEIDIERTLKRMTYEILDRNHGPNNLALVGLRTRGVHLANRIAEIIESSEKVHVPVGVLDVTMYRDDFRSALKQPEVKITTIPFDVEGMTVVLVDDVFYTGRTVRGALDALMDFGRPARVRLAVLIDRGHRELPLISDFIGKKIKTAVDEEIRVRLKEEDGVDEVALVTLKKESEP
jgi:pyrimidine operon attenuation protein / uracil phosphoribosyltransferase